MKYGVLTLALLFGCFLSTRSFAGVDISPFVSITSTKLLKPADTGKEKSTTKQKTVYGIRASLSMWRLLKFQFEVGQGKSITTTKTSEASDEWDEIDYEKDLDMSVDDPEKEVKITEIIKRGRIGLAIDPGFWIFVARAKAGVQASQRIVEIEEAGEDPVKTEPPITYKPYAGAGLGIKFSYRFKAMAEYSFFFYKFPDTNVFEREVTVSFTAALGGSTRGY